DAVNGQIAAYDDHGHGSHTTGIMVGDDGGSNQIGIAPGAEWIACKALDSSGIGYDSDLLACGEFMLAPTDLEGLNANPDLRPQVVNNSWGACGSAYDSWYEDTITAWEAAGIYPVFANGNATNCGYSQPPGLNTVGNPARGYNVTGVGSTGLDNGEYAVHSNWGPTDSLDTLNPNGYPDLKPQVVAPGVNIRSATASSDSSYAAITGTSMSAPHVAGLVTMMWEAGTCLLGDYVQTETLLQESATPIPYDTGSGEVSPNYATGWGEIDALQAVLAAKNYCGDAALVGTVTESVASQPIEGATVTALAQGDPENDRQVQTDVDGSYLAPVHSGKTFDLTASAYGYYDQLVTNVFVLSPGAEIENNFSLDPKSAVTLSGTVTDGSGQGYPLYARLTFTAGNHQEVTFTNPFDGTYSVGLYEDTAYAIEVRAVLEGYWTVTETGVTFGAPTATRDFALLVGDYCEAPGYLIANGLYQPFDEPALPTGWTVVDEAGEGVVWRFDDPAKRSNKTGGEGGFASIDARYAGMKHVDASLISPSYDFSGQGYVVLEFDQDFEIYPLSSAEIADVDISINGGAWENVLHQEEDAVGPNHQMVDVSAWAGWQSDVRVRFHYYNAYFDWWWQVDNVRVGPYDCSVQPGGGLAGFVTDLDTGGALNGVTISSPDRSTLSGITPEDPALADGFYWLFQPLATSPETITVTAGSVIPIPMTVDVDMALGTIVRQDFALKSFRIYLPVLTK
ncbi:MAG: S8 family serine peptidase, partial [Anaerolineaceae bacterium]|nr:S8 family serine peptidase [Anaerolineaceae bacterium]